MDAQHENAEVAPDALEQEFRTALNGEPSAYFVSRVRSRVADETMARTSWQASALAPAALVLIVVAAGWVTLPRRVPPAAVSRHPLPARALLPPSAALATAVGLVGPAAPPAREVARLREVSRVRRAQPQGGDAATRAWLKDIDRGRIRVVILESHPQSTDRWHAVASLATTLNLPPLAIAPVTVEPIAPFTE